MIEYKGYDMRSLAERRWARLFDAFGIHWVYEPKVFKTDVGGYLPDFYFPIADQNGQRFTDWGLTNED